MYVLPIDQFGLTVGQSFGGGGKNVINGSPVYDVGVINRRPIYDVLPPPKLNGTIVRSYALYKCVCYFCKSKSLQRLHWPQLIFTVPNKCLCTGIFQDILFIFIILIYNLINKLQKKQVSGWKYYR